MRPVRWKRGRDAISAAAVTTAAVTEVEIVEEEAGNFLLRLRRRRTLHSLGDGGQIVTDSDSKQPRGKQRGCFVVTLRKSCRAIHKRARRMSGICFILYRGKTAKF